MVFVSMVNPRILLDPPDSLFWDEKISDNCDEIFFNPLLDLKVSFITRAGVELYKDHGNNVLLKRTWTPSRSNYIGKYMNLNLNLIMNIFI